MTPARGGEEEERKEERRGGGGRDDGLTQNLCGTQTIDQSHEILEANTAVQDLSRTFFKSQISFLEEKLSCFSKDHMTWKTL